MGFFKNIGNKLKRVVSIKNLVRGVSGDFSGIGADVKRVMSTPDPKKAVNPLTDEKFEVPHMVTDVLKAQDGKYKANVINSVTDIKAVQDATDWLTKAWFQAQWKKHQNWIYGFIFVLVSFLLLRKFVFKPALRTRKRK